MEIRGISGAELGWAVKMAHEIYERCVRGHIAAQEEADQFYFYVRAENLWQEITAGRLFVWGVWENGALCGVCAMQRAGHVTMLYVRPESQRRGYGTALLRTMINYAAQYLRLGQITINVTPIISAGFFYKRGFALIPNGTDNPGYVSLARQAAALPGNYVFYPQQMPQKAQKPDRVVYPARSVKPKAVIGIACGVLGLMTVVTVIISAVQF